MGGTHRMRFVVMRIDGPQEYGITKELDEAVVKVRPEGGIDDTPVSLVVPKAVAARWFLAGTIEAVFTEGEGR